jgi:hypothetical protein
LKGHAPDETVSVLTVTLGSALLWFGTIPSGPTSSVEIHCHRPLRPTTRAIQFCHAMRIRGGAW